MFGNASVQDYGGGYFSGTDPHLFNDVFANNWSPAADQLFVNANGEVVNCAVAPGDDLSAAGTLLDVVTAAPHFENAPLSTDITITTGTTTSFTGLNGGSCAIGDVNEFEANGETFIVDSISGNTIAFHPPRDEAVPSRRAVWNWGQSPSSTVLDLRPAAGSPLIDNGTIVNASSLDVDENPRPQGDNYDIGAHEHQD